MFKYCLSLLDKLCKTVYAHENGKRERKKLEKAGHSKIKGMSTFDGRTVVPSPSGTSTASVFAPSPEWYYNLR